MLDCTHNTLVYLVFYLGISRTQVPLPCITVLLGMPSIPGKGQGRACQDQRWLSVLCNCQRSHHLCKVSVPVVCLCDCTCIYYEVAYLTLQHTSSHGILFSIAGAPISPSALPHVIFCLKMMMLLGNSTSTSPLCRPWFSRRCILLPQPFQ